jgi:addiction module HigA family antidote
MTMARRPIHPGEILGDELRELGISAAELARRINVPPNRISQILRGHRDITADTALRLGRWFGTGPQIWLNLQKAYDLDVAEHQLGEALEKIEPRVPAASEA